MREISMFETIIALTSSNISKLKADKFLKTFASYNWDSVIIEINCRPKKKRPDGSYSSQYDTFDSQINTMLHCKNTPLESIIIQGKIGNSKLEISCIFINGISHWYESKIEGVNKNTIEIIEKQIMNIFKLKAEY